MATLNIGFITQLADGTWTRIAATQAAAEALAADIRLPLRRGYVALPVSVEVPDAPPRPMVMLADGTKIVYRPGRKTYRAGLQEFASVVEIAKALPITDAHLDALQALPSDTAAWTAAGGRE